MITYNQLSWGYYNFNKLGKLIASTLVYYDKDVSQQIDCDYNFYITRHIIISRLVQYMIPYLSDTYICICVHSLSAHNFQSYLQAHNISIVYTDRFGFGPIIKV